MNSTGKNYTRRKQRSALILALLASISPSLSACGIPKLRCAQRGAAMPESFQASTNWRTANQAPASTESMSPNGNGDGTQDLSDPNTSSATEGNSKAGSSSNDSKTEGANKDSNKRSTNTVVKLVSYLKPKSAKLQTENTTETSPKPGGSNTGNSQAQVTEAPSIELPENPPNPILLSGGGWMPGTLPAESSALRSRFELFQDPTLSGLIEQGIAGNQELKFLAEEVQIACYEVQGRSGAYLPFVDYGAGIGLEKSGRLTREGAVESQLEGRPGRPFPDPVPDFLVGTTVSWEIDIWKRLRNAQRAAAMRYLATQEGRNYVVTRLVAEISENYFELLSLDNRLVALNQTIDIQRKSLEIAEAKKAAARDTELAVQRFEAEVRKNESERLIIEQSIIEVENRINQLLGRYPQPIARPSVDFVSIQSNGLNAGIPPELLRNRADIRQAERSIEAAGLDVRVAKARFYPSLGISAGVGYRAFDARYLFSTPDSLIYNVAGDLVGPLINKRAIQAEYRTANARQLQSVYNYQQTCINAFTEVVNFMTKADNYGQSIEVKKQQLLALQKSVDVANKLFQNARAEYMEVLLAQRDMMETRMVLIETKQQQLAAIINAYRALGGGCF